MAVETEQPSDLACSVPAGSAAAASARSRVVLNITLFHFLTCWCALMHIGLLWAGWGRTVREFHPIKHSSDDIISKVREFTHCILLSQCHK